jgi:hypothetical protein
MSCDRCDGPTLAPSPVDQLVGWKISRPLTEVLPAL